MDYNSIHRHHRRHMSFCAAAEIIMILCFHLLVLRSFSVGILIGISTLLIYIIVSIRFLRTMPYPAEVEFVSPGARQ